jgi:hypothetical protein
MANSQVIGFTGYWLSPDAEEKYLNWALEAYAPLLMKMPFLLGTDRFRIAKQRPEYPGFLTINYFNSFKDRANYNQSPEWNATDQDRKTTFGDSFRFIWSTTFELIRGIDKTDGSTDAEAPIIHLEGFNLSKDRQSDITAGLISGVFPFIYRC